jgi:hypothetical protein
VLKVISTDMEYNPAPCGHTIRIGVVEDTVLNFLGGGLSATQRWDTLILNTSIEPGAGVAYDTIYPYRATIYQTGAYPLDITEYRFVVEDIQTGVPELLLPDTSTPLDSIVPGDLEKLILVLPGQKHYPGIMDTIGTGKYGMPIDLEAGKLYDFWVYGTDRFFNAVKGRYDTVWITPCQTPISPNVINPLRDLLLTLVPVGEIVDTVAKKLFQLSYPSTGYGGVKAISSINMMSPCEHVRITGPLPAPEHRIIVSPNPAGNCGGPDVRGRCTIIIPRVPLGGGYIRAKIFDSFGFLVKDLTEELQEQSKQYPFASSWKYVWDLTNEKGQKVVNGCYHLCIEVVDVEKVNVWKKKIGVVW